MPSLSNHRELDLYTFPMSCKWGMPTAASDLARRAVLTPGPARKIFLNILPLIVIISCFSLLSNSIFLAHALNPIAQNGTGFILPSTERESELSVGGMARAVGDAKDSDWKGQPDVGGDDQGEPSKMIEREIENEELELEDGTSPAGEHSEGESEEGIEVAGSATSVKSEKIMKATNSVKTEKKKFFELLNLGNLPKSVLDVYETGTIPYFPAADEATWDYEQHGADWNGLCKTGTRQSPVNLMIEDLPDAKTQNLTAVYVGALKELYDGVETGIDLFDKGETPETQLRSKWKLGDVFYSYPNLLTDVRIYKTDKIFQLMAPEGEMVPLGALFPTDTTEIYLAHQILFHSPSEHTFQGEANRREVEMQIWHYSNDLLSLKSSLDVNKTSLPYLALFAYSSLVNRSYEELKDSKSTENYKSPYGHWRVISITFMAEELESTSINDLSNLPSELLLRTFLETDRMSPSNETGKAQSVRLSRPLNLQSVMMMHQLTNIDLFAYNGSTTFPGCHENVRWYVARQPLPVLPETMLAFYKMLNPKKPPLQVPYGWMDGNFRELQNTKKNQKNQGDVYFVQGFPLQVLIAHSVGLMNAAPSSGASITFALLAVVMSLSIYLF